MLDLFTQNLSKTMTEHGVTRSALVPALPVAQAISSDVAATVALCVA